MLLLVIAARVQLGLPPRTDEGWRARVRAAAPTPPAAVARGARWARRFRIPSVHGAVCDLASTPRGLVLATSRDALTLDGASLLRWRDQRMETLLTWEGQGFLRVHAFGDTLVVPDADAPFQALPFALDLDVDGYVFVSRADGALERRSREELPAVYHVFDVARLSDGRLVASTGAYDPPEVAYIANRAPAVLFVDDGPGRPWRRVLSLPRPATPGVHRFVFLHALDDGALLVGAESLGEGGAVRIEGLLGAAPTTRAVRGVDGFVLRWISWRSAVFAVVQRGSAELLRSDDGGRSFARVSGPVAPQGVVGVGDTLWLLDDGALYASRDGRRFELAAPREPSLAHAFSSLVSAPLIAHEGRLWAASTRTGEVFSFEPR